MLVFKALIKAAHAAPVYSSTKGVQTVAYLKQSKSKIVHLSSSSSVFFLLQPV